MFGSGLIDPDQQYTTSESHFDIDLDDGTTLVIRGAEPVKCRSIVLGTFYRFVLLVHGSIINDILLY